MPGRRRRAGVRRLRQRRVGRSASNVPVGGCEFDGRLEVEGLVLALDGVALSASVLEEFLALGGGDDCHVFDSCVGGPKRSVRFEHGPRRGRAESNAAQQSRSSRDRESSRRDSGSALARWVRAKVLCRVGSATGNSRPRPDILVPNLPAPKATFGPDGQGYSVNFDKHAAYLPT
jgi:hypothetical protein